MDIAALLDRAADRFSACMDTKVDSMMDRLEKRMDEKIDSKLGPVMDRLLEENQQQHEKRSPLHCVTMVVLLDSSTTGVVPAVFAPSYLEIKGVVWISRPKHTRLDGRSDQRDHH